MATNKSRFARQFLLAGLALVGSCKSLEKAQQRQLDAIDELRKTTSGAATADSTSKRAQSEIALLDSLQRKYPGRTTRTVVTKVERVTVPGEKVYVEVPVVVDKRRNQATVDSLLASLQATAAKYRQDLTLQTEVASVKSRLLAKLNQRGILPDTTVLFPNAPGYWLRVHRQTSGRYDFTLNTPDRTKDVAVAQTIIKHTPPVYITKRYWQFGQFWAALAVAALSLFGNGWLIKRVVERNRAAIQAVQV